MPSPLNSWFVVLSIIYINHIVIQYDIYKCIIYGIISHGLEHQERRN